MELRDVRWLRSCAPAVGIASVTSYDISGARPGDHLGLPGPHATLVVDLRDGLDLTGPGLGAMTRFRVCVAGLHPTPYRIHHDGSQRGVQLDLTPDAVRRLFGVPVAALAQRPTELTDLVDLALFEQIAQVAQGARADVATQLLVELADEGPHREPDPDAARTWQAISARRGNISVTELTELSGWSARYLAIHFNREYGMTLKQAARLHRFHHTRRALDAGVMPARVAADLGFADQSHLSREVRAFTGHSPTGYLARRAAEFQPAYA